MLTARQVVDTTVCPNVVCAKPAGEDCVYAKGKRVGHVRTEGPHKVRILAAQDVQPPPPPKPSDPPEPPVTPPLPRMLVGGCPRAIPSGTSWRSEGAQAVADRYPGGVVRVFL